MCVGPDNGKGDYILGKVQIIPNFRKAFFWWKSVFYDCFLVNINILNSVIKQVKLDF